ncbi:MULTISPECIES: response regulator transcription factor [Mammaliicoccus]|mgnify:CR=1 FL=1|jgi:two-component system vancomycin resistance associated response regulator VraR|uniref:Response regulator transcription factor n=1 Tax=Mammaliicoccus lentus TaxID=42858 RepID=A0ABS6GYE6_MAMLE|nr:MULTISPECIES: response regulator transcription factor [Mammaliicoccus]HBV04181.1 DNA-binding response regulator [Staphylococcus sp.]MBF0749526.1 response regulator transcription factor [Mammaliicoccus lentus]MBF0794674.1 response regulator transcription factor [Mammaliicoccus lentus]MBF0840124.1 response regulator transcription factor [Mammaliicoccus lentus]MBU6114463.1 response regulator transcription factor [Mammaliicoccus lentus]
MTIRVLFVDDHEMVRIGISSYLSTQEDISVVGEAASGREGIEKAEELKPDIILMDLVMDDMNGIEATQYIKQHQPSVKIVMLTSFIDDNEVYQALDAGVDSYILKTTSADDIANAIRKTYNKESVFEAEVLVKMRNRMNQKAELFEMLTDREMEILLLIAKGYSNQEIASASHITIKTVKTHVSNILSKLEVQDRTQAVIYAFQHNLIN